ncbi:hypothetical protein AcW1_006953 [Taiwanofungus camphoratus]|nr:hypothetical protein AcW1_006953 [Antrodia cinnamomea]
MHSSPCSCPANASIAIPENVHNSHPSLVHTSIDPHTHTRTCSFLLSFIYPFSLLSLFSYLILSFPISSLDMNHSPTRIVHIPLHPPPPSISTSVPPHSIPP